MILRGPGMPSLWQRLLNDENARGRFNATYVSPGKVRTAQALGVGLSPAASNGSQDPGQACLIIFETLAGRA
jgi:hypothetical protein